MAVRIPTTPRISFYAAALLVGALSLVPGQVLPATSVSDKLEHLLAYAALGLIGATTARNGNRAVGSVLGVIAFGIAIELVQSFLPGRLAEIGDAVADAVGAVAGGAIAMALRRRVAAGAG